MTGPEHYREAERILDYAEDKALENGAEWYANAMAAAQVHATLALVAAQINAADQSLNETYARPLVLRPTKGNDVDPAFPGSPWGRAFYGEATA